MTKTTDRPAEVNDLVAAIHDEYRRIERERIYDRLVRMTHIAFAVGLLIAAISLVGLWIVLKGW